MHKRCAELAGQLAELDCDEPLSVEGDSAPARAPRVSQHTVSRGSRKSLRHGLAKGVSVDQQGVTDSEQGALVEERPRVVQLKVDADVDADRVIAHDREVSAAPLASGKPRLKPTRGMGCCTGPRNAARCLAIGR